MTGDEHAKAANKMNVVVARGLLFFSRRPRCLSDEFGGEGILQTPLIDPIRPGIARFCKLINFLFSERILELQLQRPATVLDQSGHDQKKKWSQWSGLNRRPAVYETAALPLSYTGLRGLAKQRLLVGQAGRDITRRPETRQDSPALDQEFMAAICCLASDGRCRVCRPLLTSLPPGQLTGTRLRPRVGVPTSTHRLCSSS